MIALEELRHSCTLEYEKEKDSDRVDLDLYVDKLPQPYRILDSVLNEIVNAAFEQILQRIEKRKNERKQAKVSHLEYEGFTSRYGLPDLILSHAGERLVVAVDGHLYLDGCNPSAVVSNGESTHSKTVVKAQSVKLTISVSIIGSLNSAGEFSMYMVNDLGIFFIWTTLNLESSPAEASKVTSFEISKDGDYLALSLEGEQEKHPCIEIYSLPRETWIQEFAESIENTVPKVEDKDSDPELISKNQEEEKHEDASDKLTLQQGDDVTSNLPVDNLCTLSKPSLLMTIPSCLPGSKPTTLSLGAILKSVDVDTLSVSSGLSQLLSLQFCETHQNKMMAKYMDYLEFLQPNTEDSNKCPIFIAFLAPTKRGGYSSGISCDSQPAMFAIAREDFNQIHVYSLNKLGKDAVRKPEFVLPTSCGISHVAVSGCTTLLALLTVKNHLVIWNRQLARALKIEALQENNQPHFFKFASIAGQTNMEERLLLGISDGSQQFVQVQCSYYECSSMLPITDSSCIEADGVVDVVIWPQRPTIVAGFRESKRVTLFDLTAGDALAHIVAQEGMTFSLQNEGSLCFHSNKISVRATKVIDNNQPNELEDDDPEGGILTYSLESLHPLSSPFAHVRNATADNGSSYHPPCARDWKEKFFSRYNQREERDKFIQRRWLHLKNELQGV